MQGKIKLRPKFVLTKYFTYLFLLTNVEALKRGQPGFRRAVGNPVDRATGYV